MTERPQTISSNVPTHLQPVVGYYQSMGSTQPPKKFPVHSLIIWCIFWCLGILFMVLILTEEGRTMIFKAIVAIAAATSIPESLVALIGTPVMLGLVIMIPVGVALTLRRIREVRANTILNYIEQGVRLGFPLDTFASAAAIGEKRGISKRLRKFVTAYQTGQPVSISLAISTPEIPPRVIGIVAAAEKSGQLKEVLHEQTSRKQRSMQSQSQVDHYIFSRFYPIFLTFFFFYSVVGINIFVWPKFKEIFRDFRLTPKYAGWMYWFEFADSPWLLLGFLILIIAALIMFTAPRVIETILPNERKIFPLTKFFELIAWYIPPFRQLSQSRNFADLFAALSISFTAGRSAPDALREASSIPLNESLSNELTTAAAAIAAGQPIGAAFAQAGFPQRACQLLNTGEKAGSLGETCRFLADIYASKFSRIAIIVRNSFETFMTLVLAYFIATLPISVIVWMTQFIGAVSYSKDVQPW